MAENWQWPGARWWKCDLHIHTPASYDVKAGVTPAQWIAAARARGLEVVGVTDHETSDWIDKVRAAAIGEPPLAVFPGVEITASEGAHLIALFAPDTPHGLVDDLLALCGIGSDRRGQPGTQATANFAGCLDYAATKGALGIAAHADRATSPGKRETSLLFAIQPGSPLNQILQNPHLRAAEVSTDDSTQHSRLRRPTGKDDLPPIALLASSDAHELDQIGRRFTWIKMTRPDLEGLRLAIEDGPLSLVRSDQPDQDPNRHASSVVESITVTEGRFMGRGKPFRVQLNPWLNAVIGGRGTGKSSLVELLRIAMRREPELPVNLRDDLEKLKSLPAKRDEPGILQEETQIEVIYRKDGQRFRIQWNPAGALPAIERESPQGGWKADSGKVSERFPIRIFSQKQIFELASQPEALLAVVDDAPQVGKKSWMEHWRQEEARFLALRAKAREIEASLGEEGGIRAELADLNRKLEVFESSDYREILTTYQRRQRQARALADWEDGLATLGSRLREMTAGWCPAPLDAELFNEADPVDQKILAAAAGLDLQTCHLAASLEDLARQADALGDSWTGNPALARWHERSRSAEKAYQGLIGPLRERRMGDPEEYGRLVQRRTLLERGLADLEGERAALRDVVRQADDSLERIANLRQEITHRRSRFLAEILGSNPYVRMEVIPFGQKSQAERDLRSILGSEKYARDFEKLLEALYPDESSTDGMEERLRILKRKLREGATGQAGSAFEDARFATHLRGAKPELWDRLDLWFPEDSLAVRHSPGGDGQRFLPLGQGSPGQKAAALLAFFLSYGEEPMVLDQPEDDLDNQLITELIVRQLRENKVRRQMLVVTHNPNIVVNGDADLVLAFGSGGGQTHIAQQGGLQETEVRQSICDVMEGGREAFLLRYRRLGRAAADV